MKGLAITILLAILEVGAMATGGDDLLTKGPETASPIRREDAGIQSEMLVDAERLEPALLEPAAQAADVI